MKILSSVAVEESIPSKKYVDDTEAALDLGDLANVTTTGATDGQFSEKKDVVNVQCVNYGTSMFIITDELRG